jgi:hypothetical protein
VVAVSFPREFPLWELESEWTPKFLDNITGVKTHWIETVFISLKSSWNLDVWNGFAWPIWTSETQVMVKRKPGIKLAVWLLTTKSRESTQFPCLQVACHILLEIFRWGLQCYVRPILIGGLQTSLWAPKVVGVQSLKISGFSLGSLGRKCHLDVIIMERHRVYYKEKGGGFPQVQAVVSLVSPSLHVARPNAKNVQTIDTLPSC